MCDLGPPLTKERRDELRLARYSRQCKVHHPETFVRVRELALLGATYAQIQERADFETTEAVQAFVCRYKIRPRPKREASRTYKPAYVRNVLAQAVKDGLSVSQIMVLVPGVFPGISHVRNYLYRHSLGRARYVAPERISQRRIALIWKLVHEGKTASQIGAITGCTKNSACGIIFGYKLRYLKERPEKFVRVLGCYKGRISTRSPSDRSSPDRPVQVAAGPGHTPPRAPGPVCSYRGVTLAHV